MIVVRALLAISIVAAFATPARAESNDGRDFIDDAKLLYRIAACGGTDAVERSGSAGPRSAAEGRRGDEIDSKLEKVVAKHCKAIDEKLTEFKAAYFEKHRAWFAEVVPQAAPKTVVYPFGGGDLISALVAFPDATEITTISLELGGDPRRLQSLTPMQLQLSLSGLRAEIGGLISVGSNTTENLSAGQHNELPAQVSSFLLGLVAGGYEPTSMRYFKLDDAGTIVYLTAADIEAADKEAAAKLKKQKQARAKQAAEGAEPAKHDWQSPNFSLAFSNVEIQYRKIGDSQIRVHRHIGWNLGDSYLKTHPQLIRHLEKKGKVTMLVKGASYLLWSASFSKIRGYILDHLAWMLSDSTGVPPAFAKPAGMVQETYGAFSGAFLPESQGTKHEEAFIELWKKQKKRKLAFRFGYVDMNKQAHLLVTRPK